MPSISLRRSARSKIFLKQAQNELLHVSHCIITTYYLIQIHLLETSDFTAMELHLSYHIPSTVCIKNVIISTLSPEIHNYFNNTI